MEKLLRITFKYVLNIVLLIFYWLTLFFWNRILLTVIIEEPEGFLADLYDKFDLFLSFFFVFAWIAFAILFLPVSKYLNGKFFKVGYLENFFQFFKKFWYLIFVFSIFIYIFFKAAPIDYAICFLLAANPVGVVINWLSLIFVEKKLLNCRVS